jgi:hypothetical protein
MKTIVEIETKLSKYLLTDDVAVSLTANHIVVGEPAQFIIADLNSSTATVYGNVSAPDDWTGNKYTFNGTDWALDPNWVEED